MANLIRRTRESELAPFTSTRFDPMQLMQDLLRMDPFSEMMQIPRALEQQMFIPDFEVRETPDAYIFKADLPGVSDEDLEISVMKNRLVVSGKRQADKRDENDRYYAYERSFGSFQRTFTLPDGVDTEHVNAELRDGVLTLTLPKQPAEQAKKIDVKSAAGNGGKTQQQQQSQQQQKQPTPKH